MSEQPNPAASGGRRRGRWLPIVAVALVAAFSGALATRAVGEHGPGWGRMHGPWFMRGPMSVEQIEDRVDRGIRHAAIELDATPEQQEKLRTIAKAAVKDLLPMRENLHAGRREAIGLLSQDRVDPAALEALRTKHIGLADEASRRLTRAIAEAADVLTPAQRKQLAAHFARRQGRWGHG